MSCNFYLPAKASKEVQYSLSTPKTWAWTAPAAVGGTTSYKIEVRMYSGGAGGQPGTKFGYGGFSGSSGGFSTAKITVIPGTTYYFTVPSGGAAQSSGGACVISDSSPIITVSGGTYGGSGGSTTQNQSGKISELFTINGLSGSSAGLAGSNLGGLYGEPGGSGGLPGENNGMVTQGFRPSGAGSPASAHTSGSKGGDNDSSYVDYVGGGAGGAGYFVGSNGGNAHYPNVGNGGTGGGGYLSFKFVVTGDGVVGNPPA